jgi:hypothetical protein
LCRKSLSAFIVYSEPTGEPPVTKKYCKKRIVCYNDIRLIYEARDLRMLDLFVLDAVSGERISTVVKEATSADLSATKDWQTRWTTAYAKQLPNKVAMHRTDNDELLGLMSYELDEKGLAVEIIYVENARHSNANLLRTEGGQKKYIGIAKAFFAYAIQVSYDNHFDGLLYFRAKTSELVEYYKTEFGAIAPVRYDPFRMLILDDAAEKIISDYLVEA